MTNIIDVIKNMPNYIGSDGRNSKEIKNAEISLQTKFALDYTLYLREIGLACFDGHEFTGICKSNRLNVIDVTISERFNNPSVPKEWYVLEQTNINGIVIWQSPSGEIFQSMPNYKPVKIHDTLTEYISQ